MEYFETNLFNRENEEVVIKPVYAPIMIRLSQSHYGYQKYVLFPKDIARLNVKGLTENNNFFYWKDDNNFYSIDNFFRFSIVYNNKHLYLFETGLHQDYLDDTKLMLVEEVNSDDRIIEMKKVLEYAYSNILKFEYDVESIVNDITLSNIIIKRKTTNNENLNRYYEEIKKYIKEKYF